MTIDYDPFHRLDELRDRLLSGGRTPLSFPMDAYRRGNEFVVHLDLPGVEPDTIDVAVENQVLTVGAERRFEPHEGDEFSSPSGLKVASVASSVSVRRSTPRTSPRANDGGVLTLTLPVAERAKPRQIQVGRGGGQQQTIEGGS